MDRKQIAGLLEQIYEKFSRSKNYRIYYLDLADSMEEIIDNTEVLLQMESIPWPDNKCILISPTADKNDGGLICTLVEDDKFKSMAWRNNKLIIIPGKFHTEYVDIPEFVHRESLQKTEFASLGGLNSNQLMAIPKAPKGLILQNEELCKVLWAKPIVSLLNRVAITSALFVQLSPLLVPCGYKVSAKLPRFTKKGKSNGIFQIESLINYNRFYQIYCQSTGNSSSTKCPHPRRGHLRHWWKNAGIDKSTLPNDVAQRLKIAFENNVKRSYVKPTFCNGSFTSVDGIEFSVCKD